MTLLTPRVKMILVGSFSLAFSYLVFLAALYVGVYYQIASVMNFLTYLTINFFLNRQWSFKSNGHMGKQALAHTSLHLGNQILIMVGLYLLVEHVGLAAAWSQIVMQIIVTLSVFLLTPIIFKNR